MAKTLTTNIAAQLSWTFDKLDVVSWRVTRDHNSVGTNMTWASGVDENEANAVWHKRGTIVDAATEDIDVAGLLEDAFGDVVTLVKVKAFQIVNLNTTDGENLIVGNGPNPFASWLSATNDAVVIGAGGTMLLANPSAAGYAVASGTGDILRLTASGGDITYDLVIIGTTS